MDKSDKPNKGETKWVAMATIMSTVWIATRGVACYYQNAFQ